ncbi:MAG: hypothetical protein A2W99_15885 [Bacteroidetes bacterium GWF2_33_16]|nr:MAG: hypothetical protein A2X00_15230 [Bacteroidetes bacterium GWE2_32_14]OFY02384.1 MAG: hypothetical protein A2W99_15885 [Bacteroidetes bacterium GWF2_33_16]
MNKTEIHKNIINDIREIYSFINRFDNPNQIHQIDIDLALSKVRNLYDLLLKLNAQGTYISEYQSEEKSTIHKPTEKLLEVRVVEEIEKHHPKPVTKKQELVEQPDPVIIIEKRDENKETAKPVELKKVIVLKEEKIKKEPAKQYKSDASHEIMADKFQSRAFMHDTIGKEKSDKKDVSSKLKSKPIKDINSAIGLNDKFVFIRELFNGDKNQFGETIQLLNNFDTFENAISYLKDSFTWDFEDENVEKLVELVRRKYIN